ncbi:lysozyme-like [Arctopsyche grandis]|uniref:lysozyme-like n=1 Tax=Arctopsyche grandis TaxID=121162 RepID=UPI00406D7C51
MKYFRENHVAIAWLVSIFLLMQPAESKVFTRCQLARELYKQNFQRSFLTNWVCLIENESDKDTAKVLRQSNGSYNYGIFQINSKKWCKIGKKGGTCNIACEALLNDDITDDSACAQKIFELEGFKAWSGWMKRCKNGRLPDISNCPDLTPPSSRKISETEAYRVSPPRTFRTINHPLTAFV